jgi:hypothetical protein
MHDSGKITCSKKSSFFEPTAQLRAAANVGRPIVTMPNPIKDLRVNRVPIRSAVTGKLKNAPINGRIKLTPEKKNWCEPSIKFSLNKDKKLMQNPNMLKNRHFFVKSFMVNPYQKKDFR